MKWPDGNPYYSANQYYRDKFHQKTYKISLNIGSTCPNRDGYLSYGGCTFCSDVGSGDFATAITDDLTLQIDEACRQIGEKYNQQAVIAYLQSFTNTYGDSPDLLKKYEQILGHEKVLALSIGTRPDCLDDDLLEGLYRLSKVKPLFLELGLQTIHDKTSKAFNRGYDYTVFLDAIRRIRVYNLPVIVHLIAGLPGENSEDFIASVKAIADLNLHGVKLHLLHILDNAPLGRQFMVQPFDTMDLPAYCHLITEAVTYLPPEMVIYRLTGDGDKKHLLAPKWSADKKRVLNTLQRTFHETNRWQGKNYVLKGDHL